MKDMRMLGSMIQKKAHENNDSPESLSALIGCTIEQFSHLTKGLVIPSFEQLSQLASHFKITVDELLDGDKSYYEQNVVCYMGEFDDPANRETILDIIDDYIRLEASVAQ